MGASDPPTTKPTHMAPNYGFQEPQPSFLERMQEDQNKRFETGQLNELKREAKEVPRREAKRINKMVADFEKSRPQRGQPVKEPEKPKPGPKMVSHDRNKIREKNKYLDQWGPLGW